MTQTKASAFLRTWMPLGSDSFQFPAVIFKIEDVCVGGDLTRSLAPDTSDMLGISYLQPQCSNHTELKPYYHFSAIYWSS